MPTKNWISPVPEHPVLYLPILNDSIATDWSKVKSSAQNISIPVSEKFVAAFTHGPKSNSPGDVADAISQLVPGLMDLIRYGREKVNPQTKSHPKDFVTEMDLGIEMLLRMWINRFFPGHLIIGEEGAKPSISDSDFVWYLDPVDGTANYVSGSDMVGLNIGILKAGKPWVSCIGLPFQNQFFIGDSDSRKVRFWSNGNVSTFDFQPHPGPVVLGTEFSWDHHITQTQKIEENGKVSILRTKSICQNLAHLLLGKSSAFYKVNVKLWDIIAPLSILHWAAQDYLRIELIYPPSGTRYQLNNLVFDTPFSNSSSLINRINEVNQTESKSGIVLVYPESFSQLKSLVFDQYVHQ